MKFRFILALLLLRMVCVAQTTSVTLQVTDADSQTWNNGTWSATLTSNASNGPFAILGTSTPVPNQSQSGALSASGGATMTLTPNASIGPLGTQWAFHACPQATPAACYDFKASIQGASQSLTLTPPGIRISVVNPIIVVSAYQDLEITGQSLGSRYYNLATLFSKEWNGSSWISITPGGIPGGSPTQIQINNSGAFGGISNAATGSALVSQGVSSLPTFQTKPISDARDLGMDCTGVADSRSIWAGLAAGSHVLLPVGCITKIASNLTIPSTITVQFGQGSQLAPTTGVTVTVNGSIIAGARQQIVNTANGTVTLNGVQQVQVAWYGAPLNGISDDAPGIQAAINANPGKHIVLFTTNSTPCSSGSGGSCVGNFAAVIATQQGTNAGIELNANGTTLSSEQPASWGDGGLQISVPNTLNVPAILVDASCAGCSLQHIFVRAPNASGWNSGQLTTFENPATLSGFGNDGIVINGARFYGEDIGAENFLRHGILICGNATCGSGQPDFWKIVGIHTNSNRGFGIFTVGGDANAGSCVTCEGRFNGYGAAADYSVLGTTSWIAPGSTSDARNLISAGTTQAVSSVSVAAGVCTLTTTAALANNVNVVNTWVNVAGTSGGTAFNGTFRITAFNNGAQTLTYNCGSSGGPASGGTVGTSAATDVWNTLTTQYSVNIGNAFASNNGSSYQLWTTPYNESTSSLPRWGSSTIVMQPQNVAISGNNQAFVTLSTANRSFSVAATNLELANHSDSGGAELGIQSGGATTDETGTINFYDHTSTTRYQIFWNPSGQFFRMTDTTAGGGDFLTSVHGSGLLELNGFGATGDVVFQDTNVGNGGSGNVKFFGNSASVKAQVFSTGQILSNNSFTVSDGSFGSNQTNAPSACETTFGITTLSTVAATTDTGQNCLPANAVIDSVVYRITTTITTAASFTIGDATTAARFCATQSTLTAGTTGVCFVQADQTGAAGPRQTTAAKVRVTLNATPGAGAIRLITYYHTWTAPTS